MHASGSSSRAAAVKVLTRSPEYSGLCICWSADFPVRRGRLFAVDLALAFAFASVRGAFGSLLAAADLAFAFAFALGIFLGILELALAVVLALRGRLVCGAPSNSTLLFSCSKVAFEGEQSWRIFLLRLTRFAALLLRVFFVFFSTSLVFSLCLSGLLHFQLFIPSQNFGLWGFAVRLVKNLTAFDFVIATSCLGQWV